MNMRITKLSWAVILCVRGTFLYWMQQKMVLIFELGLVTKRTITRLDSVVEIEYTFETVWSSSFSIHWANIASGATYDESMFYMIYKIQNNVWNGTI